jgi:hypothetical protein
VKSIQKNCSGAEMTSREYVPAESEGRAATIWVFENVMTLILVDPRYTAGAFPVGEKPLPFRVIWLVE